MCGICGYVDPKPDASVLQSMVQSLSHRGPDGEGLWTNHEVALGHNRLAIIDLTNAASQPMSTPDGRYTIVFNGEIYNYRELRSELQQAGETFQSASDTEVLLLGYRKWARSVLDKLRGMFAFAVWDDYQKQLFLARDRIGIKPLFYAPLKNIFVFASEIKAILEHPAVSKEINPAAVDLYFELGYVPGPDTIFRNIYALKPGSWLLYHKGSFRINRYWTPDFLQPPNARNEAELIEELNEKLNDAVRSHLVADVSVGAFLSGGVDSSLVAAVAQKHMEKPIHTFTIGFSGGGDERAFAATVAEHIGSNHHENVVTPDIIRKLPQLIKHLEQPLFDNSILPTYLVSQFARNEVKVVLSGDGGDEPFAGYDWTRFALSIPDLPFKWSPSGWSWAYQSGFSGLLKKLAHDVGSSGNGRYLRRISVSKALRQWLYTPEFCEQICDEQPADIEELLQTAPVRDERERFIYADFCAYLPEDVLFKVDRMSMANSLEVRVPLLDHHFVGWVLGLPFSMRYRHGYGKYLLRKLAARYLPPVILKPRKQGFTVPIGRWLRGELMDPVMRFFNSENVKRRGIVKPQAAIELLNMHRSNRYELGHRIWSLIVLEVWARVWLDGRDTTESIFAGTSN
jgi:asparagine synthase (glutamine-hydrolysing)